MIASDAVEAVVWLVLQLAVILSVTRACGWLMERVGQPRVVGEIAGGLLLGPLVLGHMLPTISGALFRPMRMHLLEIVSDVGLVLFLFLMGAELDLRAALQDRGASLAITVGSIALPFVMGAAISPFLLTRFGMPHGSRLSFVLFTGIAMSITALPVLARIIQERREVHRPIESVTAATALVCAAANDLLAWSLLAFTLTLVRSGRGEGTATALRLVWLVGYVSAMLFVVRPILSALFRWGQRLSKWAWVALMVGLAFASAHVTEMLGVHAFFGAFLFGICIPREGSGVAELQRALEEKLQPIVRLTLPAFFAMTGLHTQREMFSSSGLGWLVLVLLVAVTGKIGGATLAARGSGMGWKMAVQIGVLLNTRGLVELIALNVGYKEGILSPTLFTLFVLMAIGTTAMTVPLFNLTERAG